MNGWQGSPPAYMLNGRACNVNSVMRWQETSGMINGGSRVSLRRQPLSGCAKVFLRRLGVSYDAHLLPEVGRKTPLAASQWFARTSDTCGHLEMDVAIPESLCRWFDSAPATSDLRPSALFGFWGVFTSVI